VYSPRPDSNRLQCSSIHRGSSLYFSFTRSIAAFRREDYKSENFTNYKILSLIKLLMLYIIIPCMEFTTFLEFNPMTYCRQGVGLSCRKVNDSDGREIA